MLTLRYLALTLILGLTLASCASGLKLKQQATTALQAGETALVQARTSELAFYNSHVVPAYTVQLHQRFLTQLASAQRLEIASAKAVQAWTPGSGVPADVIALVNAIQSMVTLVQSLGHPATADTVDAATLALKHAQSTAKSLGGK